MAAMIRCAMPGTIISFDPVTQRSTVKPGIRMKVMQEEVAYVDLPEIHNVPIIMPYGFAAKLLITFRFKPACLRQPGVS